ncbi:RNA-binding S4 domain-containing protein [Salaquimonas pukyongi]|uniref:RNA-binding S4 domain-containing protein n=1 Tax=Salaquimonas pukyongi TaxID=2712698 RepID=UPI00096B6C81|nr:RNA-binding S4 domain-containing protein [Salaquimonas pukyongi]
MSEQRPQSPKAGKIRLDKWLWHARQAKSRSLAQKLIQSGRVRINGQRIANNAFPVGPGDTVTLAVHGGTHHADVRLLEIVACGERRGPHSEAAMLYVDRSPRPENGPDGEKVASASGMLREKRPDARERRLARKLAGKDGF